ncbi:MAG: acetyltransferase [Desulfofustis sp.]|nr:acetyltransferase [Desulfofustis sp.]
MTNLPHEHPRTFDRISVRLGEQPTISAEAAVQDSTLGRYTEVAAGARLEETVLGDYSYVMERSDIIYAEIGKFVNIASDVRINPGNHPIEWVSQHHFLYRMTRYDLAGHDDESFFAWRRLQKVSVGHDVWIGHKAIILPGISIGNGAVIGAGTVVTRDVAPYAIVAGVPGRPIRSRFPAAIWRRLEQTAWWDWEHQVLAERLDNFRDVRHFLSLYGRER